MTPDRLHESLRWLSAELVATREEFMAAQQHGAPMLLDALLSLGYVKTGPDGLYVTDAGRRRLRALEAEVEVMA